jgi:murein DD-endopeptidase MepM/ murein hydrolase activator NlpD
MFSEILKKFKDYSILIIPGGGIPGLKSIKLSAVRAFIYAVVYSIIIFLFSLLLFTVTPLHNMFTAKSSLSDNDMKNIQVLKERMVFLARELESLKSTNERLRYAMMLGDSTLADTSGSIQEKKQDIKKKAGGNLLAVLSDLFFAENKYNLKQSAEYQKSKNTKEPLYYFNSPVNAFISRGFYPEKGHFGQDYVLKTGSPVYASAGGYVIFSDYTVKDGYMIIINHYDGFVTIYKHCSSLIKQVRETVYQGDIIALSGNTGEESIGPHLHFEIWKDGQPVNPEKYLLKK